MSPVADDLDPAAVARAQDAILNAPLPVTGTVPRHGLLSAAAAERLARAALAAAGPLVTPEHDAQVAARALREWGQSLADRYPEDVFIEPRRDAWAQIAGALAVVGHTLDAVSASCMRRAARIAAEDADRIERQEEGR